MGSIIEILISNLIAAWEDDQKDVRKIITIGSACGAIAIFLAYLIDQGLVSSYTISPFIAPIAIVLGSFSALVLTGISTSYKRKLDVKLEQKIENVEKLAISKPSEPKLAWEFATLKLEKYLNGNIGQIEAIFRLTVTVMIVGFALIIFGIYKSFDASTSIQTSVIAAASGIIVNFIGATFMILYKSAIAQSRDNIEILERINSVGMSLQIISAINDQDSNKIKHEAMIEISKQLVSTKK